MTLGLMAIMLDESEYVDRWAKIIPMPATSFDQVVVIDGGSTDDTVEKLRAHGICCIQRPFPSSFAEQRNYGLKQLVTDWVLELDADEILSQPLIAGLRTIIDDATRDKVDCIGIPRLNYIDGLLVPGPGHLGLDFQYRLHNKKCTWQGSVHEEIVGYEARVELNLSNGHFLIHDKKSARHIERNNYYKTLRDL